MALFGYLGECTLNDLRFRPFSGKTVGEAFSRKRGKGNGGVKIRSLGGSGPVMQKSLHAGTSCYVQPVWGTESGSQRGT
jgi:hypothetical protein